LSLRNVQFGYVIEWIWERLYQWNKWKTNSSWYGDQTTIFKSKYTCHRTISAEEHMILLKIARQPVQDIKLILEMNACWHILQIDILEMLHEFRPVICPLTECVMHMDKAWPCSGCTKSRNWMPFHNIYCPSRI